MNLNLVQRDSNTLVLTSAVLSRFSPGRSRSSGFPSVSQRTSSDFPRIFPAFPPVFPQGYFITWLPIICTLALPFRIAYAPTRWSLVFLVTCSVFVKPFLIITETMRKLCIRFLSVAVQTPHNVSIRGRMLNYLSWLWRRTVLCLNIPILLCTLANNLAWMKKIDWEEKTKSNVKPLWGQQVCVSFPVISEITNSTMIPYNKNYDVKKPRIVIIINNKRK